MYRSLYLCLLDLAVHGSITVLIRGIEEAQEFVTDAMQGLRTTIQAAVGGVNSGLEHTLGLIDKLPGWVFPGLASIGSVRAEANRALSWRRGVV